MADALRVAVLHPRHHLLDYLRRAPDVLPYDERCEVIQGLRETRRKTLPLGTAHPTWRALGQSPSSGRAPLAMSARRPLPPAASSMMMDTSAWLGAITTSCQPTRFGCCTPTHNSGSECIQHGVVVGGWYVYRAGFRTNQRLQRVVSMHLNNQTQGKTTNESPWWIGMGAGERPASCSQCRARAAAVQVCPAGSGLGPP